MDGDAQLRLEALEAENERLLGLVEALQEEMGLQAVLPMEFGLTGKEAAIVQMLAARDYLTKAGLLAGIYLAGADDGPEIKIIDVFVCKARKKLKPFGVEIETLWGVGYRMPAASKAALRELMGVIGPAAQPVPCAKLVSVG